LKVRNKSLFLRMIEKARLKELASLIKSMIILI
jgi:hypothetical protein